MVPWEPVWLITLSMFYYTYEGNCVFWFLCFKDTVLHIYVAINCLLMASEGNFTVHYVIHIEDYNVKCSTGVQGIKIKKKTILMRYAEQLSSNWTSNSLPPSNSITSEATEMLQDLDQLFMCISGSSIFVISRNVFVKKKSI